MQGSERAKWYKQQVSWGTGKCRSHLKIFKLFSENWSYQCNKRVSHGLTVGYKPHSLGSTHSLWGTAKFAGAPKATKFIWEFPQIHLYPHSVILQLLHCHRACWWIQESKTLFFSIGWILKMKRKHNKSTTLFLPVGLTYMNKCIYSHIM